jgi:DNA-binding response OmpR family regulator
MKILIVEDEEVLSLVLGEKFNNEGYEIMIAKDGDEAQPKAKKFKPDVILLDLILPKKGGLDILEDFKKDSELKPIPVIVLSNLETDETIKKSLALGAIDYFVKTQHPIAEIVEKVNALFIEPKLGKPASGSKK